MSTNSEWGIYVEPDRTVRKYYCQDCRMFYGFLHTRTVTDRENNSHKEYKIVCDHCSRNGTLHWSKNLAEHSWKAQNPNLNDDYIPVKVEDIMKKG